MKQVKSTQTFRVTAKEMKDMNLPSTAHFVDSMESKVLGKGWTLELQGFDNILDSYYFTFQKVDFADYGGLT